MLRTAFVALLVIAGAGVGAGPVHAQNKTVTFALEGTNPGGKGGYIGTVSLAQAGQVAKVVWHIDGETYIGTGIIQGQERWIPR